jgi:hypothetical protein
MYSFGLRHHHQGKVKDLKPWFKEDRRPFIPGNKKEAQKVIKDILKKVGQPPLELLRRLLNNRKGGAPW